MFLFNAKNSVAFIYSMNEAKAYRTHYVGRNHDCCIIRETLSVAISPLSQVVVAHWTLLLLPSSCNMFSIRSYLPLDFNRVSSLRPTYRHPFGRPFTYSLFR